MEYQHVQLSCIWAQNASVGPTSFSYAWQQNNLKQTKYCYTLLETSVSMSVSLEVMASSSAFCLFTVCFATGKKEYTQDIFVFMTLDII